MLVNVTKSPDDLLLSIVICKKIFNLCHVTQLQHVFL